MGMEKAFFNPFSLEAPGVRGRGDSEKGGEGMQACGEGV